MGRVRGGLCGESGSRGCGVGGVCGESGRRVSGWGEWEEGVWGEWEGCVGRVGRGCGVGGVCVCGVKGRHVCS